jgi:hypothetical protein
MVLSRILILILIQTISNPRESRHLHFVPLAQTLDPYIGHILGPSLGQCRHQLLGVTITQYHPDRLFRPHRLFETIYSHNFEFDIFVETRLVFAAIQA